MKKDNKSDIIPLLNRELSKPKFKKKFELQYKRFKKEIDDLIAKEKKENKTLLIITKNGLKYIRNPDYGKNIRNVRKNDK